MQAKSAVAILVCLFASAAAVTPAAALTSKECSTKYQAAKTAGTLAGKTWNEFRKAECAAEAPAAATADPTTKPTTETETTKTSPPPKTTTETAKVSPPTKPAVETTPSNAVFPTAVSSKYSSESAGRARMHTCRDQYNANKASNGNGGLKWIVKGGGYYSQCNKRLKG
jgi:hypothetical protein